MKRILVLTPHNPENQDFGTPKRVWNFWRKVIDLKDYEIDILCNDTKSGESQIEGKTGQMNISAIKLPSKLVYPLYIYYPLLYNLPRAYAFYNNSVFQDRLKKMIPNEYDIFICDHLLTSPSFLKYIKNLSKPKIIFTHNAEWRIFDRRAELTRNRIKRFVLKRLAKGLRVWELQQISKYDRITTVSKEDRESFILDGVPENKISVLENGVDCNYFTPSKSFEKNSIMFTGTFEYIANSDAVQIFLERCYPKIKEQVPNVKFYIVGRNPPKWLINLANRDLSIRVTGFVKDVKSYLSNAHICIAPLRIGGGTRLKVLEYMAMGKPVVSTSLGVEGLDLEHGKNVLIAEDLDTFTEYVINLIKDDELSKKIGRNSRKRVEEKYDWKIIADKGIEILERCCL